MAGGSQIVISDDGITISTGGKILYQAGQHKFESGKKVVSPVTVLPTIPNTYSNQFEYVFTKKIDNSCINNVECFVVDKDNGDLIASNKTMQDNKISSNRFYTDNEKKVLGMLTFSKKLSSSQDNQIEENDFEDPLLDEALSNLTGEN